MSTAATVGDAVDEAADVVSAGLDGHAPDLVLAFASPHLGAELVDVPRRLAARLGPGALIGCSGGGIVGDGREIEGAPALSVTAAWLPGVTVDAFHIGADVAAWADGLAVDPARLPHFVLLPEPFSCDTKGLLSAVDARFPHGAKIGGLASGSRNPGGNALFLGDRAHASGAVGVALHGDVAVDTVVAQGCRPIGTPLFATKVRRNVLLELDGRPALDTLHALFETLSPDDRVLFRTSLFLGVVMRDAQESYGKGDFLIRNILGLDPDHGALAVGTMLRDHQVVQFHLRDARTSADDLCALLSGHRTVAGGEPAAGALLFSCLGRGVHLYGEPDHDSNAFRDHFGAVPLGGFFCNGEIGPVGGRTFLHGYSSSFGLFRARGPLA